MVEASNQLTPIASEPLVPQIVDSCQQCGVSIASDAAFCPKCGGSTTNIGSGTDIVASAPVPLARAEPQNVFGHMTQIFGLHPIITFGVLAVDWMLFGQEVATLFVGWLISVPVAIVLGIGTAFCQRHLYEDEWGAAFGKSVIIALLTAIPTSLPTFLLLPSGVVGIVKSVRQLKSRN